VDGEDHRRGWWWLIDELAGIVGIDPAGLTLRRLVGMAEGRQRHDWQLAASLMANQIMVASGGRARVAAAELMPPHLRPKQRHIDDPALGWAMLKQLSTL
jgi:hypothetical protein